MSPTPTTVPIYSVMVQLSKWGVLLPNYPEENVVRGENVPNFNMYIQILHVRSHWDIAYMSTYPQFRFVNQVNR